MASIPLVSVVLSAYNPRYLRAAIESILNQTFVDFEFIIVDDSVEQQAKDILDEYGRRDGRIVLIRNPKNIGQTLALNRGFEFVKGDYIARQDDDDISHLDRLRQQVEYLNNYPQIGLLGTQVEIITGDNTIIDGQHFFHPEIPSAQVTQSLYLDNCICHGTVMFRRELLQKAGVFDLSLAPADDYDLWLRFIDHTEAGRLEQRLFQYRYYPGSVSAQYNHRQLHHKAVALDRALIRHFGEGFGLPWSLSLSRHYLRAAVSNFRAGEEAVSQSCLARALQLHPEIIDDADTFVPLHPTEAGLEQAELIFSGLPNTRRHARAVARLRGRLHMQQVFEALSTGNTVQIDKHIWPGIQSDISWLTNPGVISTLGRAMMRRLHLLPSRKFPPSSN
jgi:glycosyltransferase involved in cell wall biosynthesis